MFDTAGFVLDGREKTSAKLSPTKLVVQMYEFVVA